jgi:hypothetical protein
MVLKSKQNSQLRVVGSPSFRIGVGEAVSGNAGLRSERKRILSGGQTKRNAIKRKTAIAACFELADLPKAISCSTKNVAAPFWIC